MFLLFRLIRESYLFAFQAIIVNRVRTVLSLTGIAIGIFCIISVFTIFDSMEISIRKSIDSLGSNVLYIQKWPWAMGGDYPWWKYYQRPEATLNDMREIQVRSNLAEASAFFIQVNKTVKFRNNYVDDVGIMGISQDFDKVYNLELGEGRYFSPTESNSGKNVAIIGADIATSLFQEAPAIGQKIKVFGRNFEVIAVTKKEGDNMFGNSNDKTVMIPISYARNLVD